MQLLTKLVIKIQLNCKLKHDKVSFFLPSIPFFFLHKRYRKPSFGIFHKNFLQKSFKKLQVHTAVNTSSRWKTFNTKTMIHVFDKEVKGRGEVHGVHYLREGRG